MESRELCDGNKTNISFCIRALYPHTQVFPICQRRLNCSGFVKVNTDGYPKEVMYSPTSVCDIVFMFDGQLDCTKNRCATNGVEVWCLDERQTHLVSGSVSTIPSVFLVMMNLDCFA